MDARAGSYRMIPGVVYFDRNGGLMYTPAPIKLNLGAGNRRLREGYVTLDSDPQFNPDIIARVPPIPLHDESCSEVYSAHLFEHLTKEEATELVAEIWRVLEVGGTFDVTTPYALSHGAFQDPDHRSYWVQESWLYYTPHFAYLGRDYEQRFQMVTAACERDEVRVILRKTATLEAVCDCPICEYGRMLAKEETNGT